MSVRGDAIELATLELLRQNHNYALTPFKTPSVPIIRKVVTLALDASRYPAALDEAASVMRTLLADMRLRADRHRPDTCNVCRTWGPCPVGRARAWLAENDGQAT